MTSQVKITSRTKKCIQEISRATRQSRMTIIEHAVLAYHREWRMQKLNEAYAKLKQNKRAWQEELNERDV
jgi:predicted transcriptional regulator